MPDNGLGIKLGVEGEKAFRKALSDINQQFKVLGSEMKLAASEFDSNEKSVESLTAKNEVLTKQIDTQKSKIETLRSALDNASDGCGDSCPALLHSEREDSPALFFETGIIQPSSFLPPRVDAEIIEMSYGQFLGYEKGADGTPQIVEEEAEIVRLMYTLFLQGKTPAAIAKQLTAQGISTPSGKEYWQCNMVESILTNEKYKGDALLQKTFTTDFLTKKMKPNEGEVPQFYVTDSHDGIIDAEMFDYVQAEFARRKSLGRSYSCKSCFSAKLVCGDCGSFFGSKVWHSTDKYRRVIWQCNHKFKVGERCSTPHLTEDEIKERFVTAWNGMQDMTDEVIIDCRLAIAELFDSDAIDEEISAKNAEAEVLIEMNRKHIAENASAAQDQKSYNKRQTS